MMKEISAALVKAQKAFGPALKTSTNPHFKSRYADLSACVEAVIDALNSNGIAMLQRTMQDDIGVTVTTVFLHESGESWESGPLHVPAAKQDPQGYGSALTYARRYSLMAACGIAPEDDDGNAASKPATRQQQPTKQQSKPWNLGAVLAYIRAADTLDQVKERGAAAYEKAPEADKDVIASLVIEIEQAKLGSA
jgi:hypothetical protein